VQFRSAVINKGSTMIFKTKNSTYEIDQDGKRFRRLTGVNPPLGIMQPDGVWQPYIEIVHLAVGSCAVIVLDATEFIRTSYVEEIIDEQQRAAA
jgi:hypothetical protein